jgi:hypothetical protein
MFRVSGQIINIKYYFISSNRMLSIILEFFQFLKKNNSIINRKRNIFNKLKLKKKLFIKPYLFDSKTKTKNRNI